MERASGGTGARTVAVARCTCQLSEGTAKPLCTLQIMLTSIGKWRGQDCCKP